MANNVPILFHIDEHVPADECEEMLLPRGHALLIVEGGARDEAILPAADASGAVVLTADRWYLAELSRFPAGHRLRYRETGVVQLPGEWPRARPRLLDHLPLVERVYQLRKGQVDHRVGIDLSRATIRIIEAAPGPPRLTFPSV